MYEIQKGTPMPGPIRSPGKAARRKYPFDDMEIGDMFFVAGRVKNTLSTHLSGVAKQLGRKFATRVCYMAATEDGGWAPANAEDLDAVKGIGVWRTE